MGLSVNDPVTVPPVTDTALVLAEQCESLPVTSDGPVPPPDFVSGGEKVTLILTEHETEPGAAPENLGGRGVRAPAGDATADMTATTDNMAANADTVAVQPDTRVAADA